MAWETRGERRPVLHAARGRLEYSPGPRGPDSFVGKAASMNHSSVLPLTLATALLQPLHHLLALSAEPCHALRDQVASLIGRFFTTPLTPHTTCDFENELREYCSTNVGRLILQTVYNPPGAREPPRTHPSTANATARTTSARTTRPSTAAASPPCSAPSDCNAACTNRSKTLATTTNPPLLP